MTPRRRRDSARAALHCCEEELESETRRTTAETQPRIAVIGCGAISEASHIPALARHEAIRDELVLVDLDPERAQSLASRFGVGRTARDYREILSRIDGAVVAVPPEHHVSITLDCLHAGVHVLCEKPLAESAVQVDEIIRAADAAGVTVGVNNMRRLLPSSQTIKSIVDDGSIGTPLRFEYYQGAKFDWPAATGSYFGAQGSSRGVLADLGSHVVDLACWWLGGSADLISHEDDSRGGTEAVSRLRFRIDGCEGLIHLSWLTRLRNTYRIVGDRGTVSARLYHDGSVTLVTADGKRTSIRAQGDRNVSHTMTDAFLSAVRGSGSPAVSASDVRPSIALIEEAYASRSRLEMPWYEDAAAETRS